MLGISLRRRTYPLLMTLLFLSGCISEHPLCPDLSHETSVKSAGCIVLNQNRLLVMEGMNGKISIPGGSGKHDETPRCSAHRETWEETGLDIRPQQLVRQFDNGFHLYRCDLHANSGSIDPPFKLEVKRAFWLAPEAFDDHQWRFPEQKEWLRHYIRKQH